MPRSRMRDFQCPASYNLWFGTNYLQIWGEKNLHPTKSGYVQAGTKTKHYYVNVQEYLLFHLSIGKPSRTVLSQKLQQLAEYGLSQCLDRDVTIQEIFPSIQVSLASYCRWSCRVPHEWCRWHVATSNCTNAFWILNTHVTGFNTWKLKHKKPQYKIY
jgi:hypothetical protein